MILHIIIFIVSCLILIRSGTLLVGVLTRIAKFLQWSEFVVAFILMAFATSVPELFVGISSALHGYPELSFGNVIGSNIINLTLIMGTVALIARGLKTETVALRRNSIYTAVIALLPILLMLDGVISRVDGVVLLLALVFYLHRLILQEERFTKVFENGTTGEWVGFKIFLKDLGILSIGIVFLLLSAEGIVWSTTFLASLMGLPLMVVGALVIAVGTNLPEIVFGIKSILVGRKDLVLGNLTGSVVANSTLVLGVTFLICPLKIPDISIYTYGIIFMVISVLFFYIFSRTGKEISRKEAVFLLGIYVFFVLLQLLAK